MRTPLTRFPRSTRSRAVSFAETPVLFDGLKVLFDHPVALEPVNLGRRRGTEHSGGTHSRQSRPERARTDEHLNGEW